MTMTNNAAANNAAANNDAADNDANRAAAVPFSLLPESSTVDAEGGLVIGGVSVNQLAAEFGTPLFVYDEAHLRARAAEAVRGFPGGAAFASKSFMCKAMARLAYDEGMLIDVATGGEMFVALEAGVPASRLVMHGNNKSPAELAYALEQGVGRIVIDNDSEMDRLESLVQSGLPSPTVLIRMNPGIEVHTNEKVATGVEDSKFGFSLSSGAAERAVNRASASEYLDLVGTHLHIGSQVFSADNFGDALSKVGPYVASLDLGEFVVGGGLGVAYVVGEQAPTITEWAQRVHEACQDVGIRAAVGAEPGRSIVAQAAITVYTVGVIKDLVTPDGSPLRTYVAVDGGMSDNPRPVLYGSGYETFLPDRVTDPRERVVTVVGKHCESGDKLVVDAQVPETLDVGDLLATPVTGAYGHSMGSNYNKVTRPAVVFVADGQARLVIRRETYADLVSCDVG
uniref:Diaminopimelate decarboxylase n=1 Tax=uncultured bacterium A1Q1_fos_15 TaxID=1256548 RepID=L7VY87_9BACT|nr:diaminopimelate decarboxylase [uncultured bacterium A1Q1_fos_15]